MQTKIIEASNGFNWGKFLVGKLDHEWQVQSAVAVGRCLLRTIGWDPSTPNLWVLDLQTGEGAYFCVRPGAYAKSDLQKHRIWVCPLFEPFLTWLYKHPDLDKLPALVELPDAESAIFGYRRPGDLTAHDDHDEPHHSPEAEDGEQAKDARIPTPRVSDDRQRDDAAA